MPDIERRIADLKARLDALRSEGRGEVGLDLHRSNDIELTYASNAIEGNTLTHGETAELIEHGITAGGKALKDHQEIIDHYAALQWMREQVFARTPVNKALVIELHRRALKQVARTSRVPRGPVREWSKTYAKRHTFQKGGLRGGIGSRCAMLVLVRAIS